jgi:amidase
MTSHSIRAARTALLCATLALALHPAQGPAQDAPPAAGAARLAGEWIFEMQGDAQPQRVVFAITGDSLKGKVYGQDLSGVLAGARITFVVGSYRWRGVVSGDSIQGWLGGGSDSSRWTAFRVRPPAVPRALTLDPERYHRAITANVPPAMRLFSGDTVRTTTVDAGGWGAAPRTANGNRPARRTAGGNPLTGPFYVEGAVPGDVIAVRLHRVALDRDWAFSGTSLVNTAIDPAYATERKQAQQENTWMLDTAARTARLANAPAALAAYSVPVHPFLGVIATAPGGEAAPSSRESGSFGGNLEYARLREGATVYLPVSTMGAYLYLGDGHAAQGDGELTGDAMETSLAVTFSVEIVRWGFASVTRAEDAEGLMSLGVGGSLDEAMRRATSDMARWLERRYRLTSTEAAIVMGMSLRFDIADVVAPGYGVTARMPKSALDRLRPPPTP